MLYGTVVYCFLLIFSVVVSWRIDCNVLCTSFYLAFFVGFGYRLLRLRWLRVSEADDGGNLRREYIGGDNFSFCDVYFFVVGDLYAL